MSEGRQSSAPSTTSAILASIRKTVVREVERGKSKDKSSADEAPADEKSAGPDDSAQTEAETGGGATADTAENPQEGGSPETEGAEAEQSAAATSDADAAAESAEAGSPDGEAAESDAPAEEATQSSAEGDDGGEVLTLTEADMVKDGNEDQPSEEKVDDKKTDGTDGERAEGQEGAELVSAAAAAATVAALSKLEGLAQPSTTAAMALGNPTKTIEDLVREEIRPVLRLWLDENLPAIVETVVEREVERLVRARRR